MIGFLFILNLFFCMYIDAEILDRFYLFRKAFNEVGLILKYVCCVFDE